VSCAQCIGIEDMFNERRAASELRRYRRRGPGKTSRLLVESIAAEGVEGRTVLDIGAGLGAVHLELLSAGAREALDVDASAGYLRAARREAERRGLAGRIRHLHGNFVDLAPEVPMADVVTLDRVLCCYDDARSLLDCSAAKAGSILGLVYPVDSWLMKTARGMLNLLLRAFGQRFRIFVHPTAQVEAIARSHGFRKRAYHRRGLWQVVVYTKRADGFPPRPAVSAPAGR
jgi:2-polyprenyl-3-methyl-5-hydroxy-6-metoxy-1,4-benzoquinol methylase